MNSIDEQALRALTDPLFDALTGSVAPGQAPFPLKPNPRLASYYTQRAQGAMTPADFLGASCLDAGEFAQRLAAYWRAAGHPELAAGAPLVAEAARALHALYLEAQPRAELSPYIYQMF
jgi:hypothetical protein